MSYCILNISCLIQYIYNDLSCLCNIIYIFKNIILNHKIRIRSNPWCIAINYRQFIFNREFIFLICCYFKCMRLHQRCTAGFIQEIHLNDQFIFIGHDINIIQIAYVYCRKCIYIL